MPLVSCSPSLAARSWERWLWLSAACGLLWACWPTQLPALTLSESEQQQLVESLTTAERLLSELVPLLETQSERSEMLAEMLRQADERLMTLDADLQTWQARSAEQETLLERSAEALATLRLWHGELTDRYVALSQSWEGYRAEMRGQVSEIERQARRWRVGVVASAVVGAVCGVLLGIALR